VNRGDRKTMHQPRSTMNTALWTVQVLWGVFFSVTGFGKVLCYNPALWNQALHEVPCFSAVRKSAACRGKLARRLCRPSAPPRASKSPACAAAENASTTCRWRSLSGSGSVAPWFGGGALTVCELDVRVGGSWRMVFDAGDYILREGLRDR